MNICGIERLREYKLPAPRRERIHHSLANVDLKELYQDAPHGATIIVFDRTEPINQNPLREKNVRKYCIKQQEFHDSGKELTRELLEKGVRSWNIVYLIHQTYISGDISYSGRATLAKDHAGMGLFEVDVIRGLRMANNDFNPEFIYSCPIVGDRIFRGMGKTERNNCNFPQEHLRRLIVDAHSIPGNPSLDFEVYKDTEQLFYHDMFLTVGMEV